MKCDRRAWMYTTVFCACRVVIFIATHFSLMVFLCSFTTQQFFALFPVENERLEGNNVMIDSQSDNVCILITVKMKISRSRVHRGKGWLLEFTGVKQLGVKWDEWDKQWGLKVQMQVSAGRLTWSFLVLWEEAMWARYWMTFFVFSVLPAPDSPLQRQTGKNKIVSGLIQHWEDIFCNAISVDVFIIYNLRAQDGLVFTICTKKKIIMCKMLNMYPLNNNSAYTKWTYVIVTVQAVFCLYDRKFMDHREEMNIRLPATVKTCLGLSNLF